MWARRNKALPAVLRPSPGLGRTSMRNTEAVDTLLGSGRSAGWPLVLCPLVQLDASTGQITGPRLPLRASPPCPTERLTRPGVLGVVAFFCDQRGGLSLTTSYERTIAGTG
jgi:hypothetical protein